MLQDEDDEEYDEGVGYKIFREEFSGIGEQFEIYFLRFPASFKPSG